jgi:hypothetical protein
MESTGHVENTEKSISFFKKVDSYLFEKIDLCKASGPYLKFQELLTHIPLEHRPLFNQVITILLLLMPALIILVFFISNINLKSKLNTKKEILQIITEISSQQRELIMAKKNLATYPNITHKGELDQKIRQLITRANINPTSINTLNFNIDSSLPGIFRITSDIQFSKLSSSQLSEFFNLLLLQEKAKIRTLSIVKTPTEGLLRGQFQLTLYGVAGSE